MTFLEACARAEEAFNAAMICTSALLTLIVIAYVCIYHDSR